MVEMVEAVVNSKITFKEFLNESVLDNMYSITPVLHHTEVKTDKQEKSDDCCKDKSSKKTKRSKKKLYNDIKDFRYFMQIMSSIN